MAPPTPIFPSSELPSHLLSNTDTITTTSPYTKLTREKKVSAPITAEKLADRSECELMRLFQYDCKVVPMAVRDVTNSFVNGGKGGGSKNFNKHGNENGKDGVDKSSGVEEATAVKCIQYERRFWKCGSRMIEDPSNAIHWRNMQDKAKMDKEDKKKKRSLLLESRLKAREMDD